MEDENETNQKAREKKECFVTRDGRFGEIRGLFWSTRDEWTGELTFHAELPNAMRHFQEDFDVCILVVAWNLWALAGREKVWMRGDFGLSGEEQAEAFIKTTQFIGQGIEAWIQQQGKLGFAEGYRNLDASFSDGDDE